MRLGKEQAAGYVEDTETASAAEDLITHPERTQPLRNQNRLSPRQDYSPGGLC